MGCASPIEATFHLFVQVCARATLRQGQQAVHGPQ